MPVIWFNTATRLASTSSFSSGVPTSTAMTTSAPMSRTTSTGTWFTSPPSTSTWPSISTGLKTPGNDMLARMASARLP